MFQITYSAIFLCLFWAAGCSGNAESPNRNSVNQAAANVEISAVNDATTRNLQKEFERIAAQAKGRVGAAATILETGATVSINGNEKFPMQSVYKMPIAMAVLRAVDDGKLKLDQKIRIEKTEYVRIGQHSPLRDKNPNGVEASVEELVRLAVAESDGTASDVLFRLAGGAEPIGKFLSEIGANEIAVINTEKEIGKDWETQYRNFATPNGAVQLLRAFHERRGLSASSTELLNKILIESLPGQKRLKGLLPPNAVVAHKTGTGGTRGGITSATNDIGIITLPSGKHLAIAVFVSDSPADEATRERVIAEIARAAWDKLSK